MILRQFVTAHAVSWLSLLADGSVKAAVALAVAAVAVHAARRTSAAWRHLVWTVAICAALCLPVPSGVFPGWQVCSLRPPLPPDAVPVAVAPSPSISTVLAAAPSSPLQAPARASGDASRPLPPARPAVPTSAPRPAPRAPVLLVLLWGCGALIAAVPMLAGTACRWRMAARSRPAREAAWDDLLDETQRRVGVARRVRLHLSATETVPMVWGSLHPTVLLPASAAGWTEERKRLVLLHELAHVKRADCLLQSSVHLAGALYWFHPLVWLAAHRLRHERERACDDVVLAAGEKASDYAAHLLALTRTLRAPRLAGVAAVPMARAAGMGKRIQDLLDAGRARGGVTRRAKLAMAFAAVALLLPLAGVRAFAAASSGTQLVPPGRGPGGQALYTWEVGQSWPGGEQYDARLDSPVQFWDAGLTLADVFAAIGRQTGVTLGFWPEGSENPRVRVNLYLNPQQPPTLRELMAQLAWVTDCTFGMSREEQPRYYLLSTSAGTAAAESLRQQEAREKEEAAHKVQAFKDKANELEQALQLPRDEAISRYRGRDDRMLLTLLDPARRGAALIFSRRVIPMLDEAKFGPEHPSMGIGVSLSDLTEEEQAALRAAFGVPESALHDPSLNGGALVDADGTAALMPPMVLANAPAGDGAASDLVLLDMRPDAHLEPEEEIVLRRLLGETINPEQERTYAAQRSAELAAAKRARRQQPPGVALSPPMRDRLEQTPLSLPEAGGCPAWRVQEAVAQATGLSVVSDGLLHASTRRAGEGLTALGALSDLCLQGRPGELNRGGAAPPTPEWEWGDAGSFLHFRTRSRDVWRAALLPQTVVDWLDGQLLPLLPAAKEAPAADLTLPVAPEQWVRQAASLTDIQVQYAAEVVHRDPRTLAEMARRDAWSYAFRISSITLPAIRFLGSLDSDQWKQAQAGELRWPRSITPDQGKLLAQALTDPGGAPVDLRRYSGVVIALTEVAPGESGQVPTVTTTAAGAADESGTGEFSEVSSAYGMSSGVYGPKGAAPVNWYAVTFSALLRDQAIGKETTGLEKRIAFLPKAITIHAVVPK